MPSLTKARTGSTNVLGPSVDRVLSDYHESRDKLCTETILRMSTQLLKAVKFIHSAGICHGGEGAFPSVFACGLFPFYSLLIRHQWSEHRVYLHSIVDQTEEQLFDILGFPEIDGTP